VSDPFLLEGEVMPPGPDPGRPAEGEFLKAQGPGTLQDPHSPESNAVELLGRDADPDVLDARWVVTRLMREATDYGTRSRQTARVAALGMLAKATGLLDEGGLDAGKETPLQRALEMPAEERRAMIRNRVLALQKAGLIRKDDLQDD
jgi:hypothetical protein